MSQIQILMKLLSTKYHEMTSSRPMSKSNLLCLTCHPHRVQCVHPVAEITTNYYSKLQHYHLSSTAFNEFFMLVKLENKDPLYTFIGETNVTLCFLSK